VKSQYKSQDVIRIICKDGYELENPQSSLLYCSQKGIWKVFTLGDSIYIPLPRCIGNSNEMTIVKPFSYLKLYLIFCSQRKMPPIAPIDARKYASTGIICSTITPVRIISLPMFDSQEGGVNAVTSELSSTRAVYQCWYGLELDPPESEIRYCVRGKWTGENPLCGNKINIEFNMTRGINSILLVPASCPRPPSVTGGFFIARGVVNHIYVSGAAVKYYCDEGHHQKGPPLLTCSGKEWIPKDLPACVPIESSAAAGKSLFTSCRSY
jgi:hypothetical protein